MVLGRLGEAIEQLQVAEKLDPLSPEVHREFAFVLLSARQYDEAGRHCEQMSDDDGLKIQFQARVRLGQGKTAEAIELLAGDRNPNRGFLGYAYARSGRREEAEKLAAEGKRQNAKALTYAGLEDKDRTLAALEAMAPEGPQRLGQYLTYPELSVVRGDPRLRAILGKAGLPQSRP